MKKGLVVFVALLLTMCFIAGCASAPAAGSGTASKTPSAKGENGGAEDSPAAAGGTGEKLYIGLAIRGLTNPYYVAIEAAAQKFAKYLNDNGQEAEVVTLPCDGSDDAQLSGVKDFIAAHGENSILYVDPNNAPNAVPIAEYCEENGVFWQTTWSTSDDLRLTDNNYYLFHQTLADEDSGYKIAKAMFDSFEKPGEGNVLAILGMQANSASINRKAGLDKALAETPGVKLLDTQAGDWDAQKAYTITETWLSKYDNIDGIWVANDEMALSVAELLDSKGLTGKVKVVAIDGTPDGVQAVADGKMVATVYSNPDLQAGLGCAYLYKAWNGDIKPEELTAEQRSFLTEGVLITADTVEEFQNTEFDYDYSKPEVMVYQALDIPLVEGY